MSLFIVSLSTRKMKHTIIILLLLLLGTCTVTTALKNLALRGKATQSSIRDAPWTGYSAASHAIDGNRESQFSAGSCSNTHPQKDPWWRVDLLDSYIITSIIITIRGDCCAEETTGIRIGNSLDNNGNNNPRCAVVSHIAAGLTETFQCDGMEGRYVNLIIPGRKELLTLCEVEVSPPDPCWAF
uniref:Si:ch211-215k15.4 n=1 Tax=Myripristis murdjan TaxID=586833 RepID=A0A667XY18_9TELE